MIITWVESFFTPGSTENTRIHTDLSGGNLPKINWIWGGKDSVMNWYLPKKSEIKNTKPTIMKTSYIA